MTYTVSSGTLNPTIGLPYHTIPWPRPNLCLWVVILCPAFVSKNLKNVKKKQSFTSPEWMNGPCRPKLNNFVVVGDPRSLSMMGDPILSAVQVQCSAWNVHVRSPVSGSV